MRTLVSVLLLIPASAALAAHAFAGTATAKPAFAMMDNTGDGSELKLDVATLVLIDPLSDDVLMRPSILGQYVAPNGLGGYVGMSMSREMSTADWGMGSLELGGLFQSALSSDFDLGMRVGLVLPTVQQGDVLLHLASTLIARPADLVTVSPDTTWMRLGISPTYHNGPVFLRADLGLDIAVRKGQGGDPMGHINVGAGIEHYGFSATAEMQTLFTTELGGNGVSSIHTGGISARYQGGGVSPFVLVSTPLDKEFRGEVVTMTGGLMISL